jgi:signal transduction histidine kinase
VYKDSLLSEQHSNQQAILEIGYRLDKKESENITLQKDKSKREQILFLVLAGLGFLIILSAVLVRVNVQRRRLYHELATANDRIYAALQNLSILSDISLEISSTLDFETVLGALYKRVNELMDASIFAIGIYNLEENILHYALTIIGGRHLPPYKRDINDKNQFAVWALEHKKEVFINDVDIEYKNYISSFREKVLPPTIHSSEEKKILEEEHYPRSMIYVPLMVQERLVGVLSTATRAKNAYSHQHLEMLRSIATVAATAIDNASAYKYISHQQEMLEVQAAEIQLKNTELQESLETLRRTQSQLVQSEKMASLGTLVAGVSHELNTPIGVAVTAASTLKRHTEEFLQRYRQGGLKKSELENYLESAQMGTDLTLRNLDRAAELVQSFKRVAVDQTSDEKRSFNLGQYLHEIATSLQPMLKGTHYHIEIHCLSDVEIESYPGAFAQIITNLVQNSVKHGFDEMPREGVMLVTVRRSGKRLELVYSDNGRGISPELLPRIFDPFFTTKPSQGGTGLGMHIVYNLVTQKLGGEIRCESEVGKGTTFIVELSFE